MIKTVKAKKVRSDQNWGAGDMIPGLDNAYVYLLDDDGDEVAMLLHDAQGGEARLTCHRDMLITVERRQ